MEGLEADFARVAKRHRTLQTETLTAIDALIAHLHSAAPSPTTTALCATISEAYRDQQLAIHKYSKALDKRWRTEEVLWAAGAMDGLEATMDSVVARWFLEAGEEEVGAVFEGESGWVALRCNWLVRRLCFSPRRVFTNIAILLMAQG